MTNTKAVDFSKATNASLKPMIVRFIKGIRGPRQNAVNLGQIVKWFGGTPKEFVKKVVDELLDSSEITIVRNGPRSGHSHRQGYSYVPTALVNQLLPAIEPPYQPRFVPDDLVPSLMEFWWMSQAYETSRYDRMLWTSNRFHKEHPKLSSTAVYKDLDGLLS